MSTSLSKSCKFVKEFEIYIGWSGWKIKSMQASSYRSKDTKIGVPTGYL